MSDQTRVPIQAFEQNPHYRAVADFYGERCAERSGVPLINHIHEGIAVLISIGSTVRAMEAYCLHPLLQDDDALAACLKPDSVFARYALSPEVVALAMEYRACANAYLSRHYRGPDDAIVLSCLPEVVDMLVADKVQNRKDFELFHLESHPKSAVLAGYFGNWLRRLDISEERYEELLARLH